RVGNAAAPVPLTGTMAITIATSRRDAPRSRAPPMSPRYGARGSPRDAPTIERPMVEARLTVSTSPLRVLVHRNFWPYFAGNLLSNCGTWFQNLAQAVFIYRLTGSAFLVGLVNFAQFIGVFVLAPWAGSAADRFDRRRLLVVTQAG